MLHKATELLREKFDIRYITIQIEAGSNPTKFKCENQAD